MLELFLLSPWGSDFLTNAKFTMRLSHTDTIEAINWEVTEEESIRQD